MIGSVGVGVRNIAGKGDRVARIENDCVPGDFHSDRTLLDLYQLPGSSGMRVAGPMDTGFQSPVPQFEDVRRLATDNKHSPTTGLPAPEDGTLAAPSHPDRFVLWRLDQCRKSHTQGAADAQQRPDARIRD